MIQSFREALILPSQSGVVIFAHYDEDLLIREHVLYYLKGLRDVASTIIFVSDSDLPQDELKKLTSLVDFEIIGRHGEYDFGSYKRGFLFALRRGLLDSQAFCCFANDSCYGPLFPFAPIFFEMMQRKESFWGITENYFRFRLPRPHLQSFFLVFKCEVFMSEAFISFISDVRPQVTKADIIDAYEVGLTNHLLRSGFSYSSFIPRDPKKSNLIKSRWVSLVRDYQCPLLKRSLYRRSDGRLHWPRSLFFMWVLRKYTKFPINLL